MDPQTTIPSRIEGLDLVRTIAVLMVFTCHLAMSLFGWDDPFVAGFAIITATGGVDLFFALSGFLIGGILFRQAQRQNSFRRQDLLPWWSRRWWRTLPNYALFFFIYLGFTALAGRSLSQWERHLLFLQNIVPSWPIGYSFYAISWSLGVEEWAYLMLPLLLVIAIFFEPKKAPNISRACLVALLPLLLLPFAYRTFFSSGMDWDGVVRKTTTFRLDGIALGSLGAWVATFRKSWFEVLARRGFALGAGVTLLGLAAVAATWLRDLDTRFFGPSAILMNGLFFTVLDVSLVLIVIHASTIAKIFIRLGGPVKAIATLSYSIYLVHPIIIASSNWLLNKVLAMLVSNGFITSYLQTGLSKILLVPASIGGTLLTSAVIYRYWEQVMTSLRDTRKQPLPVTT